MPKGARGSRGKSKGRPNYVRLQYRVVEAPEDVLRMSREDARDLTRQVLIDSVNDPDFALPEGWVVEIGWSNHRGEPLKWDDWTNAMIESSMNGRGWGSLMLNYLTGYA